MDTWQQRQEIGQAPAGLMMEVPTWSSKWSVVCGTVPGATTHPMNLTKHTSGQTMTATWLADNPAVKKSSAHFRSSTRNMSASMGSLGRAPRTELVVRPWATSVDAPIQALSHASFQGTLRLGEDDASRCQSPSSRPAPARRSGASSTGVTRRAAPGLPSAAPSPFAACVPSVEPHATEHRSFFKDHGLFSDNRRGVPSHGGSDGTARSKGSRSRPGTQSCSGLP